MAVLVDTSVLVDAERAGRELDDLAPEEPRVISAISVSEMLHGAHRARDARVRARREAFVEHLLASLRPLPITTRIARVHAAAWAQLEAAGTPVGAHDLWIAATAIAHGFAVATVNAKDFERVPGTTVLAIGHG